MTEQENRHPMKQLDLVLCGFGQIGRMLYKTLLTRTDFRLVAVIDSSPEFIGRDAGTAAGCAPCGIPVTGSPAGLAVRADVAVVTTVSDADAAADTIAGLLGKGMPVVTTCEELFYPYPLHLDAAAKISAAAQAAQLPALAIGINPGFLMDYRVAALSGLAADIERVHVQRIQDASPRRMAFQKKIGAGQTLAEFEASRQAGRLRHVGLPESVYFVGAALGWELTRVTESIEPVVAEADLALPGAIPVKAGQARGVRQFGRGFAGGREVITLEFVAAIGEPGSTDRVHIFGTPELDSVISGGVNGDKGTCAITLNAARHIAGSRQIGLLTMLDIPPITGHSR